MNKELKRRGELIESLKSEEEASKKSEEETSSAAAAEEVVALQAKAEELQKELGYAKKGRFMYDVCWGLDEGATPE